MDSESSVCEGEPDVGHKFKYSSGVLSPSDVCDKQSKTKWEKRSWCILAYAHTKTTTN